VTRAPELVTLGWQVAHWIETLLCHGPGDVEGERIQLDDEFLAVIVRAYALRPDDGRRLVRRYVLSRAKGRAKSELAGFICCAEGLGPVRFDHWAKRGETSWWGYEFERGEPVGRTPRYPFIRCLATEEGQAGNTYDNVEYILAEGRIAEEIPGLDIGATRTFLPGGGEIRPCTAGAASKDGGKETFAVGDEEHLYVLPEHQQMHRTVSRNLLKRKAAEPWLLSTTTMFEPEKGSVAEEAWNYHLDLQRGPRTDAGFVFDHREGPEPRNWNSDRQLLASLKRAYGPAATWMDLQGILDEIRRPMTDPADARRYFLNRRARRSVENWLRQWPGAWERCEAPKLTLAAATEVAAGVDMALRHDSASVGVAGRVGDRIVVRAEIFRAPPGGRIDFGAVKQAIRRAATDTGARGVAYDPRYLELMAQELEAEGVRMIETPQSPERMVPAFGHLLELIVANTLAHDGDEALAAHVDAADWRETERGRVLSKRGASPVDACVALALACWELEHAEEISETHLW
jgi:phage terminase large subunit-like protein